MKKFTGLMGVKSNGTLVTPKGKDLFRLPLFIAAIIQRLQHAYAKTTWLAVCVILLITLSVSSCNLYKKMPQYLADHNFQKSMTIDQTTGANSFTASIDSLYDYSKVAEVCDTLDVTFRISRGSVSVKGDCSNVGDDVILILQKAISKIKFW